jgi:predicted Zn-dependent protease
MRRVPFLIFCLLAPAMAQVRVWQGTLTLPTYEEAEPNPNPLFDQYASGRFDYPYTVRDNLTDRRTDHHWRAIFLENEYLKCSVLPDLGGHLYTCTDKISGKPMFYENPSIKKAAISYRGAWAAFGIEFNFPVSHNWVTLSPVDFAFHRNSDGSASALVGNVDRVYGMQWTVELILRPGSTLLEQRVTLNNRSDVRRRFYWWNNAGVQVWDDSRIQYPMHFAASHGFRDVQPWPVDSAGKDLSIIKNQTDGPVSLFVHGSREPFMGVWNPHTDTGVVHYADYAELPAKKIWSWGVDADGLDWRKALSDNNSAYVEVQAGLYRNQETYAFLQPRQTIAFSEYWMPVREIGGVSRANLNAVVNLGRKGSALQAGLNVNRTFRSATIRISAGDHGIVSEKVDLAPQRSWSREIPSAASEKYSLDLVDSGGNVLIHHTEGEYDWTPAADIRVGPQPEHRIPQASGNERSEDDWLELGTDQELNGEVIEAAQTYQHALKLFPASFQLQKAAGRLCATLLRYAKAKPYLQAVYERDTSDGESSYYLGIAYEGLDDSRNARAAYETAYRTPEFRAAGALRLAELAAKESSFARAEYYLRQGHKSAADDLRTVEELAAVLRAEGKAGEAAMLARDWLARFPEGYFLLEELGTPDLQHMADDADRVLNVAAQYMRLGLYSEAEKVLSRKYPEPISDQHEPGALSPNQHPLVAYYRGYCREKLGRSPAADYEQASRLSTAYVFPSRAEDMEVLTSVVRANSQDATAHYLLGTLYFSRGATDEALSHWELARKMTARIPVLHASLGRALLREENHPQKALEVFQEGVAVDPRNVELYAGIDQALSILGRPAGDRVAALKRYPDQAHMPSALIYELILNLSEAGDFDSATALFHHRFFPREEGGTNVRQVWLEVQLQRALSLARSGRCDAAESAADQLHAAVPELVFTHDGLEPFLRSPRAAYLLGIIHKTCGQSEKANAAFKEAAAASGVEDAIWAAKADHQLTGDASALKSRLESALQHVSNEAESGSRAGWWLYKKAMLEQALGSLSQANADFFEAFLLPDQMLTYHLARLAMSGKAE